MTCRRDMEVYLSQLIVTPHVIAETHTAKRFGIAGKPLARLSCGFRRVTKNRRSGSSSGAESGARFFGHQRRCIACADYSYFSSIHPAFVFPRARVFGATPKTTTRLIPDKSKTNHKQKNRKTRDTRRHGRELHSRGNNKEKHHNLLSGAPGN